ncbi:MAG: 50S ribosomal protein L29 [Holosporales bacterium]|jgi:ribosomal protein L29|nr:50S ribosomal protein L29 [Holosporales bacterium]
MKFEELLKKDAKELCELCADLKRESLNLRMAQRLSQDSSMAAKKRCRRDIARVLTRLRQLKEK